MGDFFLISIFRNIYLRKCISEQLELFKLNQYKEFDDRNELLEYEYRDYIEVLKYSNKKEILSKGDLPDYGTLKTIILISTSILESIEIIPASVKIKEIKYPIHTLDDEIRPSLIPNYFNSIINIGISSDYNLIKQLNSSNRNLVKLVIGVCSGFNLTLSPHLLPISLTKLNLGNDWNNGGKILRIGDLSLLYNLKKLSMVSYKQVLLNGILPTSITSLKIGGFPNLKIKEAYYWFIPNSVSKLKISDSGRLSTIQLNETMVIRKGIIPNSIKILKLSFTNMIIEPNSIPNSVINLEISNVLQSNPKIGFNQLPSLLKSLRIIPTSNEFIIEQDSLSGLFQLQTFEILSKFNLLNSTWDQVIYPGFFPQSLTMIDFGIKYNKPIQDNVLPNQLLDLRFGFYNQPLPILPSSLTSLYFRGDFNQVISVGSLPDTLVYLNLSKSYNQIIQPEALPKSIKTILPKYILDKNQEKDDINW